MTTQLVQLTRRRIKADRVERGTQPTFELHLEEHERIVGVEHHWEHDYTDRKTVDHSAVVWVEVRL